MTSLCQQIILSSSQKIKQKDQVYAEAKLRFRNPLEEVFLPMWRFSTSYTVW
jgi:hypothetical protein